MVASDRVSAFDVIMAEPIPDKGRVLTAMTCFWCEEMADVVPGTLLAADPAEIDARARRRGAARPSGPAGPSWCAGPRCSRSSASCAATWPARPARSTSASGTVHGTAMPDRAAAGQQAGRADLHARRPRRPRGTTSTSTSPRRSTWWAPRRPLAAAGICLELYRRAAARGADGRLRPGRHQVRAGLRRRRALPVRRGVHARLVAAVAGRPGGARARRRPPSTSSRCATGWPRSPGTARRPRRRCRPR